MVTIFETVTHDLKTLPEFFEAVLDGSKTAELRKDDRGFTVGDSMRLREFAGPTPSMAEMCPEWDYTGREVTVRITHILSGWGIEPGHVMLSFAASDVAVTHADSQ